MYRLEEVLGAQEIADPVKGPIVGQDGAEQRCLDLGIVWWRPVNRWLVVVAAMQRRNIRIRGWRHGRNLAPRPKAASGE